MKLSWAFCLFLVSFKLFCFVFLFLSFFVTFCNIFLEICDPSNKQAARTMETVMWKLRVTIHPFSEASNSDKFGIVGFEPYRKTPTKKSLRKFPKIPLPESNSKDSPLKIGGNAPIGKEKVFQASIFRGEMLVSGRVFPYMTP